MPEGGAPYPEEIIESILASGSPTAEGILEALDMGGFSVTQKPPELVDGAAGAEMPFPPPEAGPEMGPEMGALGEAGLEGGSRNPGDPRENKSAIILAVRGAMDEDEKRKAQSKKEAVA